MRSADYAVATCLSICPSDGTGPIMLIVLFLVSHFNFLLVPCGGLSWLSVSFLLHVKYTLSYRIVSYNSLADSVRRSDDNVEKREGSSCSVRKTSQNESISSWGSRETDIPHSSLHRIIAISSSKASDDVVLSCSLKPIASPVSLAHKQPYRLQ